MDKRGVEGLAGVTTAQMEQGQEPAEGTRFSAERIEQFKALAADPMVYEKVGVLIKPPCCPRNRPG